MSENRVEGAVREIGGHIQDAAGGLVGDHRTQMQGKANQVAGQAQNALGHAADEIQHVGERVAAGVQDQPVGALLIAGAIGFAIGLLVTR